MNSSNSNNSNATGTTAHRRGRRAALIAGLVAATALPLAITASAEATSAGTTARTAALRPVSGQPSNSVTRIADFYGAYIDAQAGPGEGGNLVTELRKYYVDADYLTELEAWEDENHADGVLRAQNVPAKWTVTDNGKADHSEAVVTMTWGDRTTTRLVVDMNRDHEIIHIGDKGIAGK
ncbi:hypothetical protein C6Y14_11690 [Streptomyces dioscori]|uniref:SnoaL-like domain-containing protein n=1 Tax=Streptomyces dioscori TaxID=2109333 RepID=A0A2P8Q9C9_9ACTN|nr:hypothetical protein [Streptomyces dioscori]PSM42855.1 hypothetical protein C6Y14_11690 [Streptomyces dioscori]